MLNKYIIIICLIIIIIIGIGILMSVPVFAQKTPETLDEAKEIGEKAIKEAPEALKKSFNEARPVWDRCWSWIKKWTGFIWDKTYFLLNKEVEQRKPAVEEEFKKETEELKEEIVKEAPSLWQRFKNLIY